MTTKVVKKQKRRPPLKYVRKYGEVAQTVCREYGADNIELAKVLGVSPNTIEHWLAYYPDFKEAVRRGKDDFDSENVEKALLKRGLGYIYEEVHMEPTLVRKESSFSKPEVNLPPGIDADDEQAVQEVVRKSMVPVRIVQKHMPPDPACMIFWLKNRQRARWKERVEEANRIEDSLAAALAGSIESSKKRKMAKEEKQKREKAENGSVDQRQ